MRDELKKLLKWLNDTLAAHKGKIMPDDVATQFEEKAKEASALQHRIDQEDRVKAMSDRAAKTVDTPPNPDDDQPEPDGEKGKKTAAPARKIVGALRLGDFIVAQKGIRDFLAAGAPKAPFLIAKVRNLHEPLVMLDAKQLAEIKAVPTIGDGVIDPDLIPDLVRVTEHDELRLRDVINVSRTTKDAVKYIRITNYDRAAATVARGALKPEAALQIDAITEPVKTIAVWIPVDNQQLDDLPELAGLINGELLYDLAKHEEELIIFGDGSGEDFTGIMNTPGVEAAREEAGDTLIDRTRRAITDIRRAGYGPTFAAFDPLDWETVVLEKGSDNRYVWVVVTDNEVQRLWGVPVVETVAMMDFATDRRVVIVGDGRRGCTLWDRQDANVQVGWKDDQFIRNQRTILAEERLAFGVKRPKGFRYIETAAAKSS